MKKVMETIGWVAQKHNARSLACLTPDSKGRLAANAIPQAMKSQPLFTYIGEDIPWKVQKELLGTYPGLKIEEAGDVVNADVMFTDRKENLAKMWHAPIQLFMGDKPSNDWITLHRIPDEPALWISPVSAKPDIPFKVSTRNCVDDPVIQTNMINSLNLGLPCLPVCAAHGEKVVIASGGPSVMSQLGDIRNEDARIVCVKHSHDMLLDAGIIPWACLLLDPRSHVKDFVENPHPGVKYFASSTCNPTTFNRLLSRNADVWLYHARVGAGEDKMLAMFNNTARRFRREAEKFASENGLPIRPMGKYALQDNMVAGGTTAASRGINVLYMLGFRHFVLYGFDSCYWEERDMSLRKDDGQPRYHQLSIGGNKYTTDAELVAQVQDFQHIIASLPDCTFEVRGEGMVPTQFRMNYRPKPKVDEVFSDRRVEDTGILP